MTTTVFKRNMTTAEIQKKASDLSTTKGCKVYPFSFSLEGGDQVVGFISEPKRQAKMAALDKMMESPTLAGELILKSSLIPEASDPRLSSEKSEDDAVVISAYMECLTFLKAYSNELKKK